MGSDSISVLTQQFRTHLKILVKSFNRKLARIVSVLVAHKVLCSPMLFLTIYNYIYSVLMFGACRQVEEFNLIESLIGQVYISHTMTKF